MAATPLLSSQFRLPALFWHGAWTVLIGCCLLSSGCMHHLPWRTKKDEEELVQVVSQIAVKWENQIMFVPDPVNKGRPTPVLAGRMYLFGPKIRFPLKGDGTIKVELYVDPHAGTGQQPVLREQWNIPAKTVKEQLGRKDMIGWGYTLLLPMSTYRPDLNNVQILVRYTPKDRMPIFSRSALRLRHKQRKIHFSKQVQPANSQRQLPPNSRVMPGAPARSQDTYAPPRGVAGPQGQPLSPYTGPLSHGVNLPRPGLPPTTSVPPNRVMPYAGNVMPNRGSAQSGLPNQGGNPMPPPAPYSFPDHRR